MSYCNCEKPKLVKVQINHEAIEVCGKSVGGCGKEYVEKLRGSSPVFDRKILGEWVDIPPIHTGVDYARKAYSKIQEAFSDNFDEDEDGDEYEYYSF